MICYKCLIETSIGWPGAHFPFHLFQLDIQLSMSTVHTVPLDMISFQCILHTSNCFADLYFLSPVYKQEIQGETLIIPLDELCIYFLGF